MTGFLAQGGYAFYVWTSYVLSALALGATAVLCAAALRKAKAALAKLEGRTEI